MKIKNKFNFLIGVFCALCFVINIAKDADSFRLCLSGICAVGNLIIGLYGLE